MARWRGKWAKITHVIVSFLNLKGDCRMDRVRQCRLLTYTPEIVLKKISKLFKQGGEQEYSRYSQVL